MSSGKTVAAPVTRAILPVAVLVCYALLAAQVLQGGPHHMADVKGLLAAVTVSSAVLLWAAVAVRPASRTERAAWAAIATGFSGYGGGFLVLFFLPGERHLGLFGVPLSDCLSLPLYPCCYVGLALLTRSRSARLRLAELLDGGVVGLATAGVAVDWAAHTYPSLAHGSLLAIVYAFAYPVGGATLLVVTLTGLSVVGWRVDRTWLLLLSAFLVMTVGDGIYGVQSAAHHFHFGTPVDLTYVAGPVLVAMAAWFASGRPDEGAMLARRLRSIGSIAPGLATLASVVVLADGSFVWLPVAGVVLSAAALGLAVARTALYVRQERQLVTSRLEARTDHLTGLANRRALLDELQASMGRPEDTVLVLIDLDGFKSVNDALGHAVGDVMLVRVAELLRASVPGLIARLGGDEFAIVMSGTVADGLAVAADVRRVIDVPMLIDECLVSVSASAGIAATPAGIAATPAAAGTGSVEAGPAAGELLRRADVALYRAKATGSGVEPWTPLLDAGARDRLQMVGELRSALSQGGQLVAWLQPKVDSASLCVVGYEALVRWQHPRRGLLSPVEFLEVAERAALLPQITETVLDQALARVRVLRSAGEPLTVAVNVGAPDLLNGNLPSLVGKLLLRHGLPASALQLEITETVVMSNPERIGATLGALRQMGVTLSLDDYGTGLSSLAHLRSLPVSELKIDRSFVTGMVGDRANALIVASTIELAHGLGLRVVAEGVEDSETLKELARRGCDTVQGYYTGRPAPGESHEIPIARMGAKAAAVGAA